MFGRHKRIDILMKSKLLFLFVFLFTFLGADDVFAQESSPKKKIEFGVGIGTAPEFVNIFSDVFTSIFTLGNIDTETRATGGLSFSYKSRISERVELGGTYVFEYFDKTILREDNQIGSGNSSWHSFMGSADYYWINRRAFGLFSSAGIGFSFYSETQRNEQNGSEDSDSEASIAFQLDLLGLEFGRQFNVALALGFGFEGLLGLRLGYRF